MTYQKNKEMDYIQTDETSLTVFDPESGDAHFFDETGIDILNIIEEPLEFDMILQKLCEIYEAKAEDIKEDVKTLLEEAVCKNIVLKK